MGRLVLRTRSMKRETFARNSESGFTSSSKWARAMVGGLAYSWLYVQRNRSNRLAPAPRSSLVAPRGWRLAGRMLYDGARDAQPLPDRDEGVPPPARGGGRGGVPRLAERPRGPADARRARREIGRASCRERG